MNEASRYVVCVNNPDYDKPLPEMLFETLRNSLLSDGVNPAVIDRYVEECGDAKFYRNAGKRETGWLNKAADNIWFVV